MRYNSIHIPNPNDLHEETPIPSFLKTEIKEREKYYIN